MATSDVLYRDDSLIRFRLPGLLANPSSNRPVGVRVQQGNLELFRAAAITYVADPSIIMLTTGYSSKSNSSNSCFVTLVSSKVGN